MPKYLNTLKTEQLSRSCYRLLDVLKFEREGGELIEVPSGFLTNYASIKSLHNAILFPLYALVSGYGNYASTIHDYLYSEKKRSRKECDIIFYEALRAEGIARWRAYLMYLGVRIGGIKSYEG